MKSFSNRSSGCSLHHDIRHHHVRLLLRDTVVWKVQVVRKVPFGSEMRAVDVLYPMNYVDMIFNDLHIFDDVMFLHSDFE
jgi:hypothetical protein